GEECAIHIEFKLLPRSPSEPVIVKLCRINRKGGERVVGPHPKTIAIHCDVGLVIRDVSNVVDPLVSPEGCLAFQHTHAGFQGEWRGGINRNWVLVMGARLTIAEAVEGETCTINREYALGHVSILCTLVVVVDISPPLRAGEGMEVKRDGGRYAPIFEHF